MARTILGVAAGLAAFVIIVSIAGLIMRSVWPEYASVADTMIFTLPMLLARLFIGALATLAGGFVTAIIARRSLLATLLTGALLLVVFIPVHMMLWDKFPVWYHLTFLGSLVPLTFMGGKIAEGRPLVLMQA